MLYYIDTVSQWIYSLYFRHRNSLLALSTPNNTCSIQASNMPLKSTRLAPIIFCMSCKYYPLSAILIMHYHSPKFNEQGDNTWKISCGDNNTPRKCGRRTLTRDNTLAWTYNTHFGVYTPSRDVNFKLLILNLNIIFPPINYLFFCSYHKGNSQSSYLFEFCEEFIDIRSIQNDGWR